VRNKINNSKQFNHKIIFNIVARHGKLNVRDNRICKNNEKGDNVCQEI